MPVAIHLGFALMAIFLFQWQVAIGVSNLLVVYILLSIVLQFRGSPKMWINPIFFYKIYIGLSTLANIKIIVLFKSGIELVSYNYANPEFFELVSLVWFLGNLAIIMGYEWMAGNSWPRLKLELKSTRLIDLLYLISLALIFRRFWLPISLPGTFNQLLQLTPLITILFFARISEITKNQKFFFRALVLTILATTYSVLFAYLRTAMILPILVFFLGIISAGNGLKSLKSIKFAPIYIFSIVFLIFFEVFGAKRSQLSSGISRLSELRQAKETTIIKREKRLSAFERTSTIGQLSAIGRLVDENGFYNGKASQPLVTALIPRFLWPEKPPIALGVWFALEIGAALKTETWYNTSINMTIPGHLFLDFGWIGLILGGLLVGIFLRLLWNSTNFNIYPLNYTGAFFGGYLLYTCFLGFGADLQIIITILALYLITLTMDRVLRNLGKSPNRI